MTSRGYFEEELDRPTAVRACASHGNEMERGMFVVETELQAIPFARIEIQRTLLTQEKQEALRIVDGKVAGDWPIPTAVLTK